MSELENRINSPEAMHAVRRLVEDKAARCTCDESGILKCSLDEDIQNPVVDRRVQDAQPPCLTEERQKDGKFYGKMLTRV